MGCLKVIHHWHCFTAKVVFFVSRILSQQEDHNNRQQQAKLEETTVVALVAREVGVMQHGTRIAKLEMWAHSGC